MNTSVRDLFSESCDIVWKYRIKREKFQQYEKIADSGSFFTVSENGYSFLINLRDYLDTGLFFYYRDARKYVSSLVREKDVLNLFSYTSSFSVYCALSGARSTLSVDMSNTYTEWSRRNYLLNGMDMSANTVIREDCIKFLKAYNGRKFGLIIIDPPTISRSKKMDQMFDVNEDYPFLIEKALDNLSDDGTIFFSTNSRTIKYDPSLFSAVRSEDVTDKTMPFDFRDKKIHRAWILRRI